MTLPELLADFDAVFLGIGLGGVRALADASGGPVVRPAVDFIAELRQAEDLAGLPVGRRVVVIGGGMTAIDAGVQSKKLGAEEVTIAYRRGRDRMGASAYEQELADQRRRPHPRQRRARSARRPPAWPSPTATTTARPAPSASRWPPTRS